MVARKTGLLFFISKTRFQSIFDLKHLKKHHRNLIKPIHDLEKMKNHIKTQNQPEIKNLLEFRYF
jgi:hypothetical protein